MIIFEKYFLSYFYLMKFEKTSVMIQSNYNQDLKQTEVWYKNSKRLIFQFFLDL